METTANLMARLERLERTLDLPQKQAQLLALKAQTASPSLWEDQAQAVQLTSWQAQLEKQLGELQDIREMLGLNLEGHDLDHLGHTLQQLEQQALLSGPHAEANAILTIHAGTGGTDAQDFADMLLRMYLRYIEQASTEGAAERVFNLERQHWSSLIVELNKGEEAGIKKAVIEVTGQYAFGLLQSEAGVHRLVRQSPFNAKGLRQTSFALVEVIPEVEQQSGIVISPDDLRIDVYRASGKGGQGVNTTDSAVRITHLPTGLVVAVQNERSQHQNKATALKILTSKLALLQELKNSEEIAILKGEVKEGSWGNQIRSYVIHPYNLVKDHRTNCESSNPSAVLDGALKPFIEAYLLSKD